MDAEKQGKADPGFPEGEDGQRDLRADQSEGQLRDRRRGEMLGGARPRNELQGAEPDEDDAQARAQERDAVRRHPADETPFGPVKAVDDPLIGRWLHDYLQARVRRAGCDPHVVNPPCKESLVKYQPTAILHSRSAG